MILRMPWSSGEACDYQDGYPESPLSGCSQLHKYSIAGSPVLWRSPGEGCLNHPTFVNSTLQFIKLINPIISCDPVIGLYNEEIQAPECQPGVMDVEWKNQAQAETL